MSASSGTAQAPPADVLSWRAHLGEDRLDGQRCVACGAVHFPVVRGCSCGARAFAPHPLSGEGRLYAAVRVQVTSAARPEPYTVAYVDLPEGVRVFGHLDEGVAADPGSPLAVYRGVVGLRPDGAGVFGVRFRDLAEGAA